jgi:hypothetical protein
MELQHVNVKLLVKDPQAIDLEPLVPVFHTWIQDKVFDERLLDIADYRHVHDGPGVILIGHEGDYSLDNTYGRLGVRYNRKAALEGSNRDRLKQAARATLNACQRLESEAVLRGTLRFDGQNVEVFINDRLLAPNNEVTRVAAHPDFQAFFAQLFGGVEYSLSYSNDPRQLFGLSVKASSPFSVADLLKNLAS